MNVFPLKFRTCKDGDLLFADDAGGYFKSDRSFLDRYVFHALTDDDRAFLASNGHGYQSVDGLPYVSFAYRWANRLHAPNTIDYVMLVPTLRCNLACGYCQVSRADEGARGFDWSEETLAAVLQFLSGLTTERLKVEFQGGEPLLRLDLLERVRDFCRKRFEHVEFVVCTNLQDVSDAAWQFLSAADTFISTSLDSDIGTHQRQRTISREKTSDFFRNFGRALAEYGPHKVSALPTLDVRNLPDPHLVIESFASFGLRSIYLRPVNYQGFARKRYDSRATAGEWNAYHSSFIDALIDRNFRCDEPVEEYYFTHCLRRVLRPGQNGHVDLRNPNILGHSYLVVDYDGTFYPTDEARMLGRIGLFDLSMGNVATGLQRQNLDLLNAESSNCFDPDCVHCPYQAFCGVDLVDDIARYGRIDVPKHRTDFCQRHTYLFDKIFELLYSPSPAVRKSLAIWAGVPEFEPALSRIHK